MKKTIIITGSSSGFGELMVKTLAKDGHHVFATMRNVKNKNSKKAKEFENWAKENKYDVHVIELDVTSDKSVSSAVEKIDNMAGRIDVLVNNAGIGVMGLLESVTIEQAKAQLEVNVLGVLRMNRAVLPIMRNQKSGLIIHISSGLGRVVIPFTGIYTASKFAIEAIAETYNYELKNLGIDSVIIQPGAYPDTSFMKNGIMAKDSMRANEYGKIKDMQDQMFSSFGETYKDAGSPQEIADLVKMYVDMKNGKRPIRMNKGMMSEGAGMINEVSSKVQRGVLENFGM